LGAETQNQDVRVAALQGRSVRVDCSWKGFSMTWLNLKSLLSGEAKMLKLAEKLAVDCHESVWQVVHEHALCMSPAEARGYVRARASLAVKRTVDNAILNAAAPSSERERLRGLATDHVIRLISAQLRAVRPVVRTRKAA
jgi:hypothetical protein